MTTLIEEREWHGHQLVKQTVLNQAGEPIPFLVVLPAEVGEPSPCIIALHGYTSSKEEWLELDEYTKGGNLVKALADSGYAIVAIDLYGHGKNHTDSPIDYDELSNDRWEEFFDGSLASIEAVLNHFVKGDTFDQSRIGFLSYSMGGLFGFWIANREPQLFKTMVMCAPPVGKDEDDEYSSFNNLDQLQTVAMLLIAGKQDEYISFADSKWLFDQLPAVDKQYLSYESGHSLPIDYVPAAAEWFRKKL